jgi:hypothetical protein
LDQQLKAVCRLSDSDFTGLAVAFNSTIDALNVPGRSFDPLWDTNLQIPGLSRDLRSRFYLMCSYLGWFRTSAPLSERYLAPQELSLAWYINLSTALFGLTVPDTTAFNLEFGGRSSALPSTVFTMGRKDIWQPYSIHYQSRLPRETLVLNMGDEADMESAIETLSNWMNNDCNAENCVHGQCYLHSCICADGFTGVQCDMRENTANSYRWVSMAATIAPTIMILTSALVAWWLLLRPEDEPVRPWIGRM